MRLISLLFSLALVSLPAVPLEGYPTSSDGIVSRIRRQPTDSIALAAIGYSQRLHALEIEFRNGAIYRYLNVSNEIYRGLLSAESKARYYDQNIRGHYRSVHVKPRQSE